MKFTSFLLKLLSTEAQRNRDYISVQTQTQTSFAISAKKLAVTLVNNACKKVNIKISRSKSKSLLPHYYYLP